MSGITEVNPLSPHYICPKCHFVDFDSEEVKKYGGKAGIDMHDRNCPVCGEPLKKEGFDIPFETFYVEISYYSSVSYNEPMIFQKKYL